MFITIFFKKSFSRLEGPGFLLKTKEYQNFIKQCEEFIFSNKNKLQNTLSDGLKCPNTLGMLL